MTWQNRTDQTRLIHRHYAVKSGRSMFRGRTHLSAVKLLRCDLEQPSETKPSIRVNSMNSKRERRQEDDHVAASDMHRAIGS